MPSVRRVSIHHSHGVYSQDAIRDQPSVNIFLIPGFQGKYRDGIPFRDRPEPLTAGSFSTTQIGYSLGQEHAMHMVESLHMLYLACSSTQWSLYADENPKPLRTEATEFAFAHAIACGGVLSGPANPKLINS